MAGFLRLKSILSANSHHTFITSLVKAARNLLLQSEISHKNLGYSLIACTFFLDIEPYHVLKVHLASTLLVQIVI